MRPNENRILEFRISVKSMIPAKKKGLKSKLKSASKSA